MFSLLGFSFVFFMLLWFSTLILHFLLSHMGTGSQGREVAERTAWLQLSPFVPQPGDVPHHLQLA